MPIPGNNLRDNLFMEPVKEGSYEQWWWQFIAAHEDWRLADSDALRRAAFEFGKASRDVEVAFLQSRIDELMLEYCPNEMTEEQLANWAAHQRPVDEDKLPESIRARSTK